MVVGSGYHVTQQNQSGQNINSILSVLLIKYITILIFNYCCCIIGRTIQVCIVLE